MPTEETRTIRVTDPDDAPAYKIESAAAPADHHSAQDCVRIEQERLSFKAPRVSATELAQAVLKAGGIERYDDLSTSQTAAARALRSATGELLDLILKDMLAATNHRDLAADAGDEEGTVWKAIQRVAENLREDYGV